MRVIGVILFAMSIFLAAGRAASDEVPRFFRGNAGELAWEFVFTLPSCVHEGEVPYAFCTREDEVRVNAEAGVEERIMQIIRDSRFKQVMIATFSFSNKRIVEALCTEANGRGLKVRVFVDNGQLRWSDDIKKLRQCSANIKVVGRGTKLEDSDGYIQHAKMIMATPNTDLQSMSELVASDPAAAAQLKDAPVVFTSTSANLSSVGVGLDFESWMFLRSGFAGRLAQENLCFFAALERMQTTGDADAQRTSFAELYAKCAKAIAAPSTPGIAFYPVPHGGLIEEKTFEKVKELIGGAEKSIKVAVHRLTTASVFKPLLEKHAAGVAVIAAFDDDTLRTGKCDGGSAMPVSANAVFTYRMLRDAGVDVRLVETNGKVPHLFHNKHLIVDDKSVFVGAGNFTAASLNSYGLGNFEQFYLLTDGAMVDAFVKSWDYYVRIATKNSDHEVAGNKDKAIVDEPSGARPGLKIFVEDSCGA